jgi:hypothetical protein
MTWILSDKRTLLEQVNNVVQLVFLSIGFDIAEDLSLRKTGKRVFDSGTMSAFQIAQQVGDVLTLQACYSQSQGLFRTIRCALSRDATFRHYANLLVQILVKYMLQS